MIGKPNEVVSKYTAIIDYSQDSAGSEEALRLGINYRAIKVGNKVLKSNPTAARIENAIIVEAKRLRLIVEEEV